MPTQKQDHFTKDKDDSNFVDIETLKLHQQAKEFGVTLISQINQLERRRLRDQKIVRNLEIIFVACLVFAGLILALLKITNTVSQAFEDSNTYNYFIAMIGTLTVVIGAEKLGQLWARWSARSKNTITIEDLRVKEKDLYNNIQKDIDIILGKLPDGKYSKTNP